MLNYMYQSDTFHILCLYNFFLFLLCLYNWDSTILNMEVTFILKVAI